MSATEILEELPRLNPADLEAICRRVMELHQGLTVEATPELLAAIDEADESFQKEGGVGMDEARRIAAPLNSRVGKRGESSRVYCGDKRGNRSGPP